MINWTDSLKTGHEVIDNDHFQLIVHLNALHAALLDGTGKDRLPQMLEFMDQYTRGHFAREEAYMCKIKCPSQTENCRAHKELVGKLDLWKARIAQSGANTSLLLEVHREIQSWLSRHIQAVDMQAKACKPA